MMIRKINDSNLRKLCKEKGWYNCNNGNEHKYLMLELVKCKENLSKADIMAIAVHIMAYSDMDNAFTIESVISELDRITDISFEET